MKKSVKLTTVFDIAPVEVKKNTNNMVYRVNRLRAKLNLPPLFKLNETEIGKKTERML